MLVEFVRVNFNIPEKFENIKYSFITNTYLLHHVNLVVNKENHQVKVQRYLQDQRQSSFVVVQVYSKKIKLDFRFPKKKKT